MTTYRLTGLRITWTDTDGDGEDDTVALGTSELVQVAPTGKGWISWTLKSGNDGVIDTGGFSTKINGSVPPDSWDEFSMEMSWGNGKSTDALGTSKSGDTHIFVMSGDPLPDLKTAEDLEQFGAGLTDVPLSSFKMDLANVSGVRISENDRIIGTKKADVGDGGLGKDKMYGKGGNDRIDGGKGKDLLDGGNGNDVLTGGKGNDKLIGGNGQDKFVFRAGHDKDRILDFTDDQDTLKLDDALWSDSHGTLTRKQVLKTFGSDEGDTYVLDFGDGDMVTIETDISRAALINDLSII